MNQPSLSNLRVKLFADGANLEAMLALADDRLIRGFTTNPTLMRQSGVKDYARFAREVLKAIPDRPISFEVLADTPDEIRRQALLLADWGENVYVKVPITTSEGKPLTDLIHELSHRGVKLNVTAILPLEQVQQASAALHGGVPSIVSVFAGRVADSGRDPVPHMRAALAICRDADRNIELLWASPRELLNVVQADECGTDIITVTETLRTRLLSPGQGFARVQPGDRQHVQARRRKRRISAMSFSRTFLDETAQLVRELDADAIERVARGLAEVRAGSGRLFILGVGGSAGHAGHAVNDFRKLCGFEAYAPTDNVSELTARVNDEGWDTCFSNWLAGSRLAAKDGLLVFSVGGGNREKKVSTNIVRAIELANQVRAQVFGIVGRDGGFTREQADVCVVIPPRFPERITPHTEGLCAVVWHLLVSHPALQQAPTRWESIR